MWIYSIAAKAVPLEQRKSVYEIYAKKANEYFSIAKAREVYEKATDTEEPYHINDEDVKSLCLAYARLEKNLGEIERARAILTFASEFSDPHDDKDFWKEWDQFEVQHGNVDTFKDMSLTMRA